MTRTPLARLDERSPRVWAREMTQAEQRVEEPTVTTQEGRW